MASLDSVSAIAAYRSAVQSIIHNQGVTKDAQAQFRAPYVTHPVSGSTHPFNADGSLRRYGTEYQNHFPMSSAKAPELSFSSLLKEGVENTIAANRHAEYIAMEGVAGRADVTEVVTAIANAEASLSTLVSVRDKMITAYQEIMKMPV